MLKLYIADIADITGNKMQSPSTISDQHNHTLWRRGPVGRAGLPVSIHYLTNHDSFYQSKALRSPKTQLRRTTQTINQAFYGTYCDFILLHQPPLLQSL
jgi:hypothetical protein